MRSLEPKILECLATGNKTFTEIYKVIKPERQQDLWAAIAALQQQNKIKPYFINLDGHSDFLCPLDPNQILCYQTVC